VQLEQLG